MEKKRGLLIAGGGTGGHIYPAIAIAQSLKEKNPDLPIDFVGTPQGLEVKIVTREKFPLHLIKVGALNQVGALTKIITLLRLPFAILSAARLLLRLKPRAVLGVGGYVSGPVMLAAVILRPFLKLKLAVFEPNAYPGMTNRWIARHTDIAFTNFEVSNRFFEKVLTVGIPIRSGLVPSSRTAHSKLRVLIFGGSQGARGINLAVLEAVKQNGEWLKDVEIVHQIGSTDFSKIDSEYKKINPKNVQWFEFLYDMPERYKWADLVVCRAGASTLAELAACHKAAVLIPFPFAADNHQQENADALMKKDAAVMLLQKDLTPQSLSEVVMSFRSNPEKIKSYEARISQFYKPQSAEKVAENLVGDFK